MVFKKGYKMTEEMKKNLSLAHLGKKYKPMGEEGKRNLSISHKGKGLHKGICYRKNPYKHNDETKLKISNSHKGIKNSQETRKKISLALKGKAKSEQGKINIAIANKKRGYGLTKFSLLIRNIALYKKWRIEVFLRDSFTCQNCNKRTKIGEKIKIQAHHINSFGKILKEKNIINNEQAEKCQELWDISNGITLCEECHNLTKKSNIIEGDFE